MCLARFPSYGTRNEPHAYRIAIILLYTSQLSSSAPACCKCAAQVAAASHTLPLHPHT